MTSDISWVLYTTLGAGLNSSCGVYSSMCVSVGSTGHCGLVLTKDRETSSTGGCGVISLRSFLSYSWLRGFGITPRYTVGHVGISIESQPSGLFPRVFFTSTNTIGTGYGELLFQYLLVLFSLTNCLSMHKAYNYFLLPNGDLYRHNSFTFINWYPPYSDRALLPIVPTWESAASAA